MFDPMFMLVTALAFAVFAGLGLAFTADEAQERAAKRAKSMGRPEAVQRGKTRAAAGATTPEQRRKQILDSLKEADRAQRKARVSLQARLLQAGLSASVKKFWIMSLGLGLAVAAVAVVLRAPPLIALGLGFVFGLGFPRWVLGFLAKRRLKKFTSEFSNAMDVIVRGIKSGLPVHDCLKIIARESPQPLAGEFQRLVEGLGMGVSIEQALEKMYERMPTAELKFFAIVISIQQKTGGNLAEALSNLSQVLRARKMMREKIRALSSEAIASASIIGSLPPAVLVIIAVTTPSYMLTMFQDKRGHLMLLAGVVWMTLGILAMRKMINFKF